MYSVKKIINNRCPYITKDKDGERVYVKNLDKRQNQQKEKNLILQYIRNLEDNYPVLYERFTQIIPEDYIKMLVNDFIYKEIIDYFDTHCKKAAIVNDNRKTEESKYNQLIGIVNEALVQIMLELQGLEVIRVGSDSDNFWKSLPSTTPDLLIRDKKKGEEFYCDVKYKDYLDIECYRQDKNKDLTWDQIDNNSYKIGIKETQLDSYIKNYNAKILVNLLTPDNKMIYFLSSAERIDRDEENKTLLYTNSKNPKYNKYGYKLDYQNKLHKILELSNNKLIMNEGYIQIFTYNQKKKNKTLEYFDDVYKEWKVKNETKQRKPELTER